MSYVKLYYSLYELTASVDKNDGNDRQLALFCHHRNSVKSMTIGVVAHTTIWMSSLGYFLTLLWLEVISSRNSVVAVTTHQHSQQWPLIFLEQLVCECSYSSAPSSLTFECDELLLSLQHKYRLSITRFRDTPSSHRVLSSYETTSLLSFVWQHYYVFNHILICQSSDPTVTINLLIVNVRRMTVMRRWQQEWFI
jgi:hypothetical protein